MAYIVQRNDQFYVVDYDGVDPAPERNPDAGIPPGDHATTPKQSVPGSKRIAKRRRSGRPNR